MALKGGRELHARLRAIKTVFKPVAREWTDETVALARPQIPIRTGRTRASVRRGRVTQKRATVVGSYVTNFIDAGTQAHTIRAKRGGVLKFQAGGRTVFAKKVRHPSTAAHPFKKASAQRALEKVDILDDLIKLWNQARGI